MGCQVPSLIQTFGYLNLAETAFVVTRDAVEIILFYIIIQLKKASFERTCSNTLNLGESYDDFSTKNWG